MLYNKYIGMAQTSHNRR